jgi:hypothetical protein
MNRLLTFILALICCLGIQAQNQKFLDGLRANEPGKGTVTVTQSPAIDVLVNGKYVAKGEVVVIEESFGIRITEIMK